MADGDGWIRVGRRVGLLPGDASSHVASLMGWVRLSSGAVSY